MSFAKLSVVGLVRRLDPYGSRKSQRFIAGTVVFWTLFAIFSLAFQCGLPSPWLYVPSQCHDGAFEYIVVVLNVLSDLYLAIFFIPTVWSLQMDRSARATVTGFFGSRVLYVCYRVRFYSMQFC